MCIRDRDGSVVPCTTLDRSASAGNVLNRPLAAIWQDGFAEIRRWRPEGRCVRCQYAPACGGGCWLQRRRGQACYREVWHVPAALKTAAGVAVCLGAILAGEGVAGEPAQQPAGKQHATRGIMPGGMERSPGMEGPLSRGRDVPDSTDLTGGGIEEQILLWTASSVPPQDRRPRWPELASVQPDESLRADPAWKFFDLYRKGSLPADWASYAKAVEPGLDTRQRSLSYAALLWRSMTERLLADRGPAARSGEDRETIRRTLAAMEKAANHWRKEIFDKRLDPYLARDRRFPRYAFEMSKAQPRGPVWLELARDTAPERWGQGDRRYGDGVKAEALDGWLDRHPYAEAMAIPFTLDEGVELTFAHAQGQRKVKGSGSWGIYDILLTGAESPRLRLAPPTSGWRIKDMSVALPARCEVTYADLLQRFDGTYGQTFQTLRESGQIDYRNLPAWPCLLGPLAKWDRALRSDPKDPAMPCVAAWLADFWLF
jgi:radical SAM protein with 4Fe4S-binding SPASM domain